MPPELIAQLLTAALAGARRGKGKSVFADPERVPLYRLTEPVEDQYIKSGFRREAPGVLAALGLPTGNIPREFLAHGAPTHDVQVQEWEYPLPWFSHNQGDEYNIPWEIEHGRMSPEESVLKLLAQKLSKEQLAREAIERIAEAKMYR